MISLVIADDEERICRLIKALGDWDALGIRVIATASNGLEALDLIKRESVDLLITDIRMPGLGGMDLIREVNQVSPETRIIIISGYSNFEYAQTAIEYGVKGYLLKPINRQELNETLLRQTEEIRKEQHESHDIQIIRQENEQAVRRTRQSLVTDLLSNPARSISGERLRDYYHFRHLGGSLFILVLKFCDAAGEVTPAALRLTRERAEEILVKQMEDIAEDLVLGWDDRRCVCILGCGGRQEEELRRRARESLRRVLVAQETIGGGGASLGIGGPVADPLFLPQALEAAQKAVLEHLLHGTGRVCTEDVRKESLPAGSLLDHFTRDISPALEMLDMIQAAEAVRQLQREADAVPGMHGWEILELVRQAGAMMLMRMEVSGQGALREEFYRRMDGCASEDDLFQLLEEFALSQMEKLAAERQDTSNRAVRLAKQYIQQHYPEPITLEGVAGYVDLNEAYFSTLFKKETGEGFARYLASVRLEMAKRQLRETSLPVAEVCRRVGYNDVKHFSRIFEKSCGVTPAAYRRLYG